MQDTRALNWGRYFPLPLIGEADGEDGVRLGEGVSELGFGLRIAVP